LVFSVQITFKGKLFASLNVPVATRGQYNTVCFEVRCRVKFKQALLSLYYVLKAGCSTFQCRL